jgi:hypothetical protein
MDFLHSAVIPKIAEKRTEARRLISGPDCAGSSLEMGLMQGKAGRPNAIAMP